MLLKDKRFWIGVLVAYGIAFVLPPSRLMAGAKKKSS